MSFPERDIGWKFDLSPPSQPASLDKLTSNVKHPPGEVNDIYLELDRFNLTLRGYWVIFSCLGALGILYFFSLILHHAFTSPTLFHYDFFLVCVLIFSICIFAFYPYARMDLEQPCNEPLRANRYRRKIYVYRYRFDRLHPFSKAGWGVTPVAYDWDDLVAEAYRVYIPSTGLIETVKIAVRKPGTDEVIDRFILAGSHHDGIQYWNMLCLFMQHGPDALPQFKNKPIDWAYQCSRTPFRRRAPKVQWPADMDLESRTAPAPGAPR